ncbi:MAG TPA: ATPase, T2SS/T4P/T4SS family, partial [Spirochaetota bacterium]
MAKTERRKLGDILIERNLVSKTQLDEALSQQKATGLRIGELLIKKGAVTEEDLLSALAEHYGLPYQKKIEFHDPDGILKTLPSHFLTRNKLVPFNVQKKNVRVGVVDPLNLHPFDDLKMVLPDHKFEAVLTAEDEIQRIIHTHFAIQESDAREVIDEISDDFESIEGSFSETEDLLEVANDAPIIRLVNRLITQAVHERASDIHIEPYEQDLAVRFRIDGIMYRKATPPKKLQNAVISRVKIMSNLNIAENRLPQDGRIQLKIGGKDIDIRV